MNGDATVMAGIWNEEKMEESDDDDETLYAVCRLLCLRFWCFFSSRCFFLGWGG